MKVRLLSCLYGTSVDGVHSGIFGQLQFPKALEETGWKGFYVGVEWEAGAC